MTSASDEKIWVIIPAAGIGKRMGSDTPKQYLKIKNKTIIEHSISSFINRPEIFKILVVLHPDDAQWSRISNTENVLTTVGGETRAHSVMNGLQYLQEMVSKNDWVLVHDAARPCLNDEVLDRFIHAVKDHPIGGLLALPVSDTLKKIDTNHEVRETVSRESLWAAQTPQIFRYSVLYEALQHALDSDAVITDESSAIELSGGHPLVVKGDPRNIKVTRAGDLPLAEKFL